MHLMLEELWVQIASGTFVEALVCVVPDGGVGEVQKGSFVDRPRVRRFHVNLDHLIAISEECEMSVRVYPWQGLAFEVARDHWHVALGLTCRTVPVLQEPREPANVDLKLGMLTNEGPNRQRVDVQLVPVVVVDHGAQGLGLLCCKLHLADLLGRRFNAESNVQSRGREELVALERIPDAEIALFDLQVLTLELTEAEGVVLVRLLGIVVGADLVGPNYHLLLILVVMRLLVCSYQIGRRRMHQDCHAGQHCTDLTSLHRSAVARSASHCRRPAKPLWISDVFVSPNHFVGDVLPWEARVGQSGSIQVG
mmetsp:Transcript_30546/g.65807  ORF Transcript_30546/g.65807 Transcript_30546/m.65807 type:complete len:309 (+) Transcript_30546:1167-2093(+)